MRVGRISALPTVVSAILCRQQARFDMQDASRHHVVQHSNGTSIFIRNKSMRCAGQCFWSYTVGSGGAIGGGGSGNTTQRIGRYRRWHRSRRWRGGGAWPHQGKPRGRPSTTHRIPSTRRHSTHRRAMLRLPLPLLPALPLEMPQLPLFLGGKTSTSDAYYRLSLPPTCQQHVAQMIKRKLCGAWR